MEKRVRQSPLMRRWTQQGVQGRLARTPFEPSPPQAATAKRRKVALRKEGAKALSTWSTVLNALFPCSLGVGGECRRW